MDNDWVIMGRFGRPHGIKGFITVISFTEPLENILDYSPWYTKVGQVWQPLKLLRPDKMSNGPILVQIEGYPEREQVAQWTNVEIAIPRVALPSLSEGEYYWHELLGMEVVNQEGHLLGNIQEIMPTGANDVLVVKGDARYLIPYLPKRYVIDIDTIHRRITVDWDLADK